MEDAVENMALFRRFVLNIVKQSNCGARSQRNKLKRAGWNDLTIGLSYSLVKNINKVSNTRRRWSSSNSGTIHSPVPSMPSPIAAATRSNA